MSTPTTSSAFGATSTSAVPSATPTHHHQAWWIAGKIAGVAVGAAIFLLLLAAVGFFICFRKVMHARKAKKHQEKYQKDTTPVYHQKSRGNELTSTGQTQEAPQYQNHQAATPGALERGNATNGGAAAHSAGHNDSWHPSQAASQQGGTFHDPHSTASRVMNQNIVNRGY